MKKFFWRVLPVLLGVGAPHATTAQALAGPAAIRQQKQLEFSLGAVAPRFYAGRELLYACDLRAAGRSYGGNGAGVGAYGHPLGWSLEAAYFRPWTRVPGLLFGVAARSTLTGTQPAGGGYAEGYFFNCVDVGPALKYYPFAQANFFLRAEAGMASVFTKNRYQGAAGAQQVLHQFGIGVGGTAAVGYTFTPCRDKTLGLETRLGYQLSRTRVEVSGLGDDQWRFGALHAQVGVLF